MDLDFDDTLLRGLRQYVGLVSTAMNMGRGYACLQAERPATAYLPLDGRLPGHPDRDVALLWEESRGWTAVVERLSGVDLTVVAEMGGPVLPAPAAVANWVREVRLGLVGRRRPPVASDVSTQLASYALAAAG
jgi:hypothetical protein